MWQQSLVRRVGAQCRDADRPLVLEILPYPLPGEPAEAYGRALPALSIAAAEAFADSSFGVDLYKLALPGIPDGVREWGGELYGLDEPGEQMRRTTRLLPAPWVLLSGGMRPDRFVEALQAAVAAGARGYLAGRSVSWAPIQAYPDLDAVRRGLSTDGVAVLRALNRALMPIRPQAPDTRWRLPV